MASVFYNGPVTNGIMTVELTHYIPGMVDANLRSQGIIINFDGGEPQPEQIDGKIPVKKVNVATSELFYEHIDFVRVLTDKEKIKELELQQGNLLMEIAMLKMGGMM